MGLFNGDVFNGFGGAGVIPDVGVPLSTLIMPAYRIAGVTRLAMVGPNQDKYDEAVGEYSRMVGSWNCARPNIFTVRIDQFPLVGSQKIYTIGDGADFDMPRPQAIQSGVIILAPTDAGNAVRMPPMYQMNDAEWAEISLQNIPNGVPLGFYYDGSYDDAGWGRIYLWPQTTQAYSVEWYTWQAIPAATSKDDRVTLPPGYQDAIVYNLAVRLANLNPEISKISPMAIAQARKSLAAIQSLNAPTPKINSDFHGSKQGGRFDYRTGLVR